jgi:hypothetical protein
MDGPMGHLLVTGDHGTPTGYRGPWDIYQFQHRVMVGSSGHLTRYSGCGNHDHIHIWTAYSTLPKVISCYDCHVWDRDVDSILLM